MSEGEFPKYPPRHLTPQDVSGGRQASYMQGFVCLGSACEDTCCSGWSLVMSRKDHRRLTLIVGRQEVQSATLRKPAAQRPTEDWAPGYAEFRTQGDQRCHYLDSADLCRLHSEHGSGALTNVCEQYPRSTLQLDDWVEQVGTLGCPEVARRCLLANQAPRFVSFDPHEASLDRPPLRLNSAKDGYHKNFLLVRERLLNTLTSRELSMGDRLAALLGQAEALTNVLQRGKVSDEARLKQVLEHISSEDRVRQIPSMMTNVQLRGRATVVLVSFVLGLLQRVGRRTEGLIDAVRRVYDLSNLGLSEAEFERIVDTYEVNRSQILALHNARVDTYFTNYACKHLLSLPFFDEHSLGTYVKELVLRVAMLRFLFFSHPRVLKLADGPDGSDLVGALDDAAIAIFQPFAREFEHSPGAKNKLHGLLIEAAAYSTTDFLTLTRL